MPTLTGMAACTLKAKYEACDDSINHVRAILCRSKNPKEIYYQFEDEPETTEEAAPADSAPAASAPSAAYVVVAAPVAAPSGPAASIKDVPLRAVDILVTIVAQISRLLVLTWFSLVCYIFASSTHQAYINLVTDVY